MFYNFFAFTENGMILPYPMITDAKRTLQIVSRMIYSAEPTCKLRTSCYSVATFDSASTPPVYITLHRRVISTMKKRNTDKILGIAGVEARWYNLLDSCLSALNAHLQQAVTGWVPYMGIGQCNSNTTKRIPPGHKHTFHSFQHFSSHTWLFPAVN
jgi:hypothetical protein